MNVLITAYDRKMRGRARDVERRALRSGAKPRVYKPKSTREDRWDD